MDTAKSEYELTQKKQINADVNDKRKAHNTFWQHMDAKCKF